MTHPPLSAEQKERLRELCAGTPVWQVRKGDAVTRWFNHSISLSPATEAQNWLATHMKMYPGRFAGYRVAKAIEQTELQRGTLALLSELAAVREELEAMRADAERYRWLRDEDRGVPPGMRELYVIQQRLPFTEGTDTELFDTPLDKAIDAAIAQSKGADT